MKNIIRKKLATLKAMCSACFPRSVKSSRFSIGLAIGFSPVSGGKSIFIEGENDG